MSTKIVIIEADDSFKGSYGELELSLEEIKARKEKNGRKVYEISEKVFKELNELPDASYAVISINDKDEVSIDGIRTEDECPVAELPETTEPTEGDVVEMTEPDTPAVDELPQKELAPETKLTEPAKKKATPKKKNTNKKQK